MARVATSYVHGVSYLSLENPSLASHESGTNDTGAQIDLFKAWDSIRSAQEVYDDLDKKHALEDFASVDLFSLGANEYIIEGALHSSAAKMIESLLKFGSLSRRKDVASLLIHNDSSIWQLVNSTSGAFVIRVIVDQLGDHKHITDPLVDFLNRWTVHLMYSESSVRCACLLNAFQLKGDSHCRDEINRIIYENANVFMQHPHAQFNLACLPINLSLLSFVDVTLVTNYTPLMLCSRLVAEDSSELVRLFGDREIPDIIKRVL